jgi:cobalt/nickel transport system permease protein
MGMVGTLMAYFVYRAALGRVGGNPARVAGAAFFSGWLAVVLASVFASVELAVSGTAPLDRVLPAMVFTHMIIGVGEGLITAAVVVFVLRSRPDLLHDARVPPRPVGRPVLVTGLGAALACGVGLSLLPVLWDYPDGLESVGIQHGFIPEEPYGDGERLARSATPPGRTLAGSDAPPFEILPDYSIAGVNALAGTSLAGGIGAVLMFGLSFGVGRALVRSPRSRRRGRVARRPA